MPDGVLLRPFAVLERALFAGCKAGRRGSKTRASSRASSRSTWIEALSLTQRFFELEVPSELQGCPLRASKYASPETHKGNL